MGEGSIGCAVARVRERVSAAAARSGRDAGSVRVVAATKGVEVGLIEEAVAAGIHDLGENQAKLLREKAVALGAGLRWHFLGSIQTNKVRYLDEAHLIHGVDRAREAAALQARAERLNLSWDVLIEVNIAREPQKQGVGPGEVAELLEKVASYPLVRPRGFMFVAPQVENPEDVRDLFAQARGLLERYGLGELSMGMSDDFEVAIEEGATIVRIGRAIFRPEVN